MIEIRWHGRGGQGAFTASKILGGAAVLGGKYALSFPSFGPERRGAPITAYTKLDDRPIADRSAVSVCDYMVFLDETLYRESYRMDLKPGGKIFVNTRKPQQYEGQEAVIAWNADDTAQKLLGRAVSNTAMLAVLTAYSTIVEINHIKQSLHDYLPEKLAKRNEAVIDAIAAQLPGEQPIPEQGIF